MRVVHISLSATVAISRRSTFVVRWAPAAIRQRPLVSTHALAVRPRARVADRVVIAIRRRAEGSTGRVAPVTTRTRPAIESSVVLRGALSALGPTPHVPAHARAAAAVVPRHRLSVIRTVPGVGTLLNAHGVALTVAGASPAIAGIGIVVLWRAHIACCTQPLIATLARAIWVRSVHTLRVRVTLHHGGADACAVGVEAVPLRARPAVLRSVKVERTAAARRAIPLVAAGTIAPGLCVTAH